MSKLALAVQDAVDAIASGENTDTTVTGEGDQMAKAKRVKKPKAERVKKAAKSKAVKTKKAKGEKKARRARKTNGEATGRVAKTYKLVNGIPDTLRNPSAGRSVLEAIDARGAESSTPNLQADLGKDFPSPTLRFYLGKFQRDGVVAAR